jgi:hypothetical protein
MGTMAAEPVQLKPRDPESKGFVERVNGYFETSFMPGRTFTSPADFNAQLLGWLGRANHRRVRAIAARPTEAIAADRAAMLPLPPGRPGHRAPHLGAVGPGLLRADRWQRLLRGPDRDRRIAGMPGSRWKAGCGLGPGRSR